VKKKQTTETIPNQLLNKHGSFLCKEIISKEICYFITHALLRKSQVEGKEGDEQIPNALTTLHHDLFLETLPLKCKDIFPSKINIFMPNSEIFIDTKKGNRMYDKIKNIYDRYEELKSIDFVLCKTKLCYYTW
jgi:hypothetical protein